MALWAFLTVLALFRTLLAFRPAVFGTRFRWALAALAVAAFCTSAFAASLGGGAAAWAAPAVVTSTALGTLAALTTVSALATAFG